VGTGYLPWNLTTMCIDTMNKCASVVASSSVAAMTVNPQPGIVIMVLVQAMAVLLIFAGAVLAVWRC
jgi:hypothetical protein